MIYLFITIGLLLTILMCFQESRKRRISLVNALLFCIFLTPLIGYFLIISRPLRDAKGCQWCGNDENEANFCGICGKNEEGLTLEELNN